MSASIIPSSACCTLQPAPPDPNKRRLRGEIGSLDPRKGRGVINSPMGDFHFLLSNSLTHADRRQILDWCSGLSKVFVEFSVINGSPTDDLETVTEVVAASIEPSLSCSKVFDSSPFASQQVPSSLPLPPITATTTTNTSSSSCTISSNIQQASTSSPASATSSSPTNHVSVLMPLLADQADSAICHVDRTMLARSDCDDPSLTRHPPMFLIFWDIHEFLKIPKQNRTVPVVMVRTRLTVATALMAISNEQTAVGLDTVILEDNLLLLSVCTGIAVFVFDLPKMLKPERDMLAMFLISSTALRPQIPMVSLSIQNFKKLCIMYPDSFSACKPQIVGIIDVLQAAQQVLPEISKRAKSAEELLNMVFGYKHAPRPTKSEDAALSIAFGRPAFHSRQVFAQLNNLARNQSFAALLDHQASSNASSSLSTAGSDSSTHPHGLCGIDDSSPTSSATTASAYKRRRLGSSSSIGSSSSSVGGASSPRHSYQHSLSFTSESSVQIEPSISVKESDKDKVKSIPENVDANELNAGLFMEWLHSEIGKVDD